MTDLILFLLAATGLFNGLTNLVMVRAVRKHLKATTDLAMLIANPVKLKQKDDV